MQPDKLPGKEGKLPPRGLWDKGYTPGENLYGYRARLNAKFFLDEKITAFISIEKASPRGPKEAQISDNRDKTMGLNQGWLQFEELIGPVGVKIGRQVLSYGKMRILGHLEWSDQTNRWNGSKIFYESEAVDADMFFAKLYTEDSSARQDNNLNGVYVTIKSIPITNLEVYAIQKDVTSGTNFMTYGLRAAGKAAGLDWDFEYMTQSGDMEKVDHNASAWAAEAGYTIKGLGDGLRIGLQSWAGSGDDSTTDDTSETFDNLYPTNHPLYGISDVAGTSLQDRIGSGLNISFKPISAIKIKAEYVTVSEQASGNKVGNEVNLQFWYTMTKNIQWHAYLAQFSPDQEYVGKGNETDPYQIVGAQVHAKF